MGGNKSKPKPEKLEEIPISFNDVIFQFDPESYSQGSPPDLDTTFLYLRTISSVVPLLAPFSLIPDEILKVKKHGDNILNFVENVKEICEKVTEEKISQANLQTAISLLKADCAGLKKTRDRMYNEKISPENKKGDVPSAVDCCIKLRTLFDDKTYAFWNNVIPSSEFLLHFPALYADVMWLSAAYNESYRSNVFDELQNMRSTLEEYKKKCVNVRATYVYYKKIPDDVGNICHEFGDRWGKPWEKDIYFMVPSFYEAETTRRINNAKVEIEEYRGKVKTAYASKFDEAIQSYKALLLKVLKIQSKY